MLEWQQKNHRHSKPTNNRIFDFTPSCYPIHTLCRCTEMYSIIRSLTTCFQLIRKPGKASGVYRH